VSHSLLLGFGPRNFDGRGFGFFRYLRFRRRVVIVNVFLYDDFLHRKLWER